MKLRTLAFSVVAACSLLACDTISDALPEYTLGAKDGVPPVSGSTKFDLPAGFKCGDPIVDPNMKYTIKTAVAGEDCVFTFHQDVTALKAADYAGKPEIKGAQLVKRVDIDVTKLGVSDGAGMALSPKDLTGKAFGATILTKEDLLQKPPFTKSVEGQPIEALKDTVQKQQDIIIPIEVVVTVSMNPMLPPTVALDFDGQPNLVFGF